MSNGTCSHAGAVFSSPTLLPEQRMRRYRQTASKLPRYRPAMLFPFAASPYNNLRGAGADFYPVHAYRPVRPPASRDAQAHWLRTTRFSMQSCSSCLPSPARPTMKLLPVHIHRRPTPPHIRQHKGYIHASPAPGTNTAPAVHGPSLCPLPHHGCLRSCAPQGNAE